MAESLGISKRDLLENYYYDEFLTMLDEHNDMHKLKPDTEKKEYVTADAW